MRGGCQKNGWGDVGSLKLNWQTFMMAIKFHIFVARFSCFFCAHLSTCILICHEHLSGSSIKHVFPLPEHLVRLYKFTL